MPRVCVVSTADFAGNARPSPILIYFLSLRRQDHHAGSHSSQVLGLIARGRSGPVTAYLKVMGPGDRCPSIGGYPGCHLSVRNIGIQAREPLSSDRRTLLDSRMQGMKSKMCIRKLISRLRQSAGFPSGDYLQDFLRGILLWKKMLQRYIHLT